MAVSLSLISEGQRQALDGINLRNWTIPHPHPHLASAEVTTGLPRLVTARTPPVQERFIFTQNHQGLEQAPNTDLRHPSSFLDGKLPESDARTVGLESKVHDRGTACHVIVQELCEIRGGRPVLSILTSLMVSVDVKQQLNHASALVSACP